MHLATGAIITKRTSRAIIATHYLGKLRVAIDYSQRNDEAHAYAAAKLVRKLATAWRDKNAPERDLINAPFTGQWIGGDLPEGSGFAFSYAGETNRTSGIEPRGFVQNCEREREFC
jgi:hypothetical protein